jgi:uncharacterized damage-inducible protein DinB
MDHNGMLSAYQFQRQYLTLLVEDIPEEKMTFQPAGVVNHPAWQLAHLAVVQDRLVQILGGKSKLDPDWEKRFGRGSTPAPAGAGHPTRADLLGIIDERRGEFVRLFSRLGAEELAKQPSVPGVPPLFKSLGMFLTFVMMSHESTHLGQLSVWRRAMGMCEALSKLPRN